MRSRLERRFIYKPSKTVSGILLMMLHALAMAVLYMLNKKLTQHMHPFQLTFLYKFTILLAILPWCFWGNFRKNLKTKRFGMHVARGTFSLLGTLCFTIAIANLPAIVTAGISYLEHILIILIGVFYFKEKLNSTKAMVIVLSSMGAILIIKPGFVNFNTYYIFVFLAIIFWAINCTVIKMLGITERTKAQLFYMMLFSVMFSLPMALYEWKPLENWQIKYLLGIALCYLIHAVAFFKAFKYADLTTVMPFEYCRLIFTGILGYFVFTEIPDRYSVYGYSLIAFAGLYSIYIEAKKHRQHIKLTKNQKVELEAEYEQI